ncbi:MAG: ATP-binding cassette domain-containing protein [Gemmatimonadetes bacterium]|nr:ATP-binding cassette domain-containing protein [Gemmatimonadota bacterium]
MSLANFSIRRPVTTAMFFLAVSLLGLISLGRLQVELMPEVVYPEIFVTISQQGMSPEQIERDLVMPVEEEVGQLLGVVEMTSAAALNRGNVRISYEPGTDMKFALLQVQSRMDRLQPGLPEQTQISVQRFDEGDLSATVMELQVLAQGADLNWLRDYTEKNIAPELAAVEGVVNAQVLGGQQSAVEIVAEPERLQAYQLTMANLRGALTDANRPRAYLGAVYDGRQVFPVSFQGQFSDLRQIDEVLVDSSIPLRLGDVAEVGFGLQQRTDLSRVNGQSAVGILIQKEDEENLIKVADAVVETIARLNRDFAHESVELIITSNQAELMEDSLDTLKQAALVGLALGLAVLFLFLRNARFVAILLLAIPASLLATFNLMYAWDLTLNVLSLCGLALAMGMLTDNSIVVMESIFKHFERGKSAMDAARDGTAEVSKAVVAATATTALVFLPVVFIQSDFQDILRELALAITFPLLASLVVALSLVPSVAARMLGRRATTPLGTGRLMLMYTLLLKASLRHRAVVAYGVFLSLIATLVAAFFLMLEQEVIAEETQFSVYASLSDGATLQATDEVMREIEAAVGELPGVDRYTASVQEGQGSLTVMLLDRDERPERVSAEELKAQLEDQLQEIQGGLIGFQPQASSFGGGGGRGGGGGGGGGGRGGSGNGGFNLQAGATSETALIKGYDFAVLQMISDDLSYRFEELEAIDANSVRPDLQRSAPEIQVIPSPMALFDHNLRVNTVLGAISDANPQGFATQTNFLKADGSEISIEVRPTEDPEADGPGRDGVGQIPVLTATGEYLPLAELAKVRVDEGRNNILRTDQARRVELSYQFLDEILDSQPLLDGARAMVRAIVQDLVLPGGYTIEIVEVETDTVYYWMMGIAAILTYMVLASLFESFAAPLLIFCTLPTAAIGSCWALMLTGTGLTSQAGPMALLGFIVLIGIAVNNGIILIDAIGTLRDTEGFRRERAVLVAGRSRVRPILMTSATTLLGVLPLALDFGGDYEVWPPFAITVLGGLAVSMVSTLIFVPVAYMGLDQVRMWLVGIGRVGVGVSTAIAAAATGVLYVESDSYFWPALIALPLWFLLLGAIALGLRIHRARVARHAASAVQVIRLQTLTKVYGAPGRFRREWARFDRHAERLLAQGIDPVDRKAVKDGLSWKLPLMGLAGYLHLYFEDVLWIYLLSLASWGLGVHLLRQLALLGAQAGAGSSGAAPPSMWLAQSLRALAHWAVPLLFVAYVHHRLALPSLTLASAAVWLAYRGARWLADRVRRGQVDIEGMVGRMMWLRRKVYGGAAALPLIGVAKPTYQALYGVNLEIGRGMFGLLGPNGAGKTTMMRIICQVLEPSSGSVAFDGVNITRQGPVQGVIGYLPQYFGLYEHMTAYQYLDYRALLEGFRDAGLRRERVNASLVQVNLEERQDDAIGSFSGGMKQRVGIAQTLLHLPQIIVVDEPTAGLDPVERIRFRNLLARISQERIVIFSTHIVEDISGSCNRLAVLNSGRILYQGTPREMRDLASGNVWETVVEEAAFEQVDRQVKVISHLRTPRGIRARFLAAAPVPGLAADRVDPTLEDAYLYLLRREVA